MRINSELIRQTAAPPLPLPGVPQPVSGRVWQPADDQEARRSLAGFSLLEMTVAMAILLVISAAALSLMSSYTKTYNSTHIKNDMFGNVRGVAELMAQEVGQAGLVRLPATTINQVGGVTGSGAAQAVTVTQILSFYIGENILVDVGAAQETVALTNVNIITNQITGIFANSHSNGALITVQGVYSNGVMTASTGTTLHLFGDIRGDGTLYYIRYAADTVGGTLSRCEQQIIPGTTTCSVANKVNMLTTLTANPGGTPVFQIVTQSCGTYTIVNDVSLTLTVQSQDADPVTGAKLTMTKSFLNLVPRNLLAACELGSAAPPITSLIQATPPGLPYS